MGEDLLIDCIKDCFNNNKKMIEPVHEKALNLYRIYLITGGMPECISNMIKVNGDFIKYDKSILKDILNSYFKDMNKYVSSDMESLRINRVYNFLPSQLLNISKKFKYSDICKDARAREYISSLDWLLNSNMVLKCKSVNNPEIPLEGFVDDDTFKLYLSDVGILNSLLKLNMEDILTDNISLYKGITLKNYVANQLVCREYELYFWKSDNTAKIDFLLYNKDGIIPVEVKAGDTTQSKSLKLFIEKYKPKYAIRISSKDFEYDPNTKIKSIPLYATFLL